MKFLFSLFLLSLTCLEASSFPEGYYYQISQVKGKPVTNDLLSTWSLNDGGFPDDPELYNPAECVKLGSFMSHHGVSEGLHYMWNPHDEEYLYLKHGATTEAVRVKFGVSQVVLFSRLGISLNLTRIFTQERSIPIFAFEVSRRVL